MSQEKYGMESRSQLLSVHDLSVSFAGKPVVQEVSFELAAGEKLALVGESGSGKSVTALSLLRLVGDAQLGGQALLDGRDLLGLSEREMQGIRGGEIAMIFQDPMTSLNPVLTIGTQEDKVADLALKILAMLALNTIEEDELAIRHAQAPRAGRTPFRQTRPTKPWVEQTTIDRQMIGRRGNLAARAGARVDVAIELQTDERRVVDIEPPALNQDFSVPLEAESVQRAQDGIGGTRHRARPINVLDAHQPFAAMCPRIEITADGGDE